MTADKDEMLSRSAHQVSLSSAEIAILADALVSYALQGGPLVKNREMEQLLSKLSRALEPDAGVVHRDEHGVSR